MEHTSRFIYLLNSKESFAGYIEQGQLGVSVLDGGRARKRLGI